MKTQHDGDCTIGASLNDTSMPEAGICVCGYGYQQARKGDWSEMYSEKLQIFLIKKAHPKIYRQVYRRVMKSNLNASKRDILKALDEVLDKEADKLLDKLLRRKI
jgi:hypothetical protein